MPAKKPKKKTKVTPPSTPAAPDPQLEVAPLSTPAVPDPQLEVAPPSTPAAPDPQLEVVPQQTLSEDDREHDAYLTLAMTAFSYWRAKQLSRTCFALDRAFAHFRSGEPITLDKVISFIDLMAKNGAVKMVQEIAAFESLFYKAINEHLDKKVSSK